MSALSKRRRVAALHSAIGVINHFHTSNSAYFCSITGKKMNLLVCSRY
jgi:hypothetical protein